MRKLPKLVKRRRRRLWWLFFLIATIILLLLAALLRLFVGKAEWAGMTVGNVSPRLALEFHIPPEAEGVVVEYAGGPAYKAGVRRGDLLVSINNRPVKNVEEFVSVAESANLEKGVLLDVLREGHPLYITMQSRKEWYPSTRDTLAEQFDKAISLAQSSPVTGVALSQRSVRLPSPAEQRAAEKELVEGHWLGMEVLPLMAELAQEFGISPDTKGVLVDEISLEAAESGVLAGDVILAVDGVATPDLRDFTEATRRVKNRTEAKLLISRKGRLVELTIRSERTLGFSQNESAQPIQPGAISPHRSRGKPCTSCHIIMQSGGQLPIDAGDILPSPPPIPRGAVPPHGPRGACNNCHVILK